MVNNITSHFGTKVEIPTISSAMAEFSFAADGLRNKPRPGPSWESAPTSDLG